MNAQMMAVPMSGFPTITDRRGSLTPGASSGAVAGVGKESRRGSDWALGFRGACKFIKRARFRCAQFALAARGAPAVLSGGKAERTTLGTVGAGRDSLRSVAPVAALRPSFYRPELDFLRFFAFLAVFVHHAVPHEPAAFEVHGLSHSLASWLVEVPKSGAYGVDLFFVLSAYLITELLQREFRTTGQLDVRSFYIRRILRIWPLYFSFLSLCAVLSLCKIARQQLGLTYVLAFVFLAGNWACAFKGYPSSAAAPLWSVSIEEQFYLAWPALMRLIKVKWLLPAALTMISVAFASRLVLLYAGASYLCVWCNTLARLDPIACGIILAVWLRGRRPVLPASARAALAALATSICLGVARTAPLETSGRVGAPLRANLLIGYPAVAVASSLMVVLILACDLSKLPKWISSPAVYLGRISYGLYVFHVLSITMVNLVNGDRRGTLAIRCVVSLLITVLLSVISYQLLEQPFLRLKLKYTHVLSRPGG